jgi:hypothetical protein
MIKPKLSYLFIFLILLNYSCDPGFKATIVNNTNKDAIVEVQFDEADFDRHLKSNIPIFEISENPNLELLAFDKPKLTIKIKIYPHKRFEIESGLGSKPTFNFAKKISIITTDTIVLNNYEEMSKKFLKTRGTFSKEFELEIK